MTRRQSDDDDRESLMAYRYWKSEHHNMVVALKKLAMDSNAVAENQGITPGKPYLWLDCLANALYEKR
jgi:hypothetical protein